MPLPFITQNRKHARPRNRRAVVLYTVGAALLGVILMLRATTMPLVCWHTLRTLLGLTAGAVVLGGLFWAIESLWPEDELQPRWSEGSKTSGAYLLLNAGVTARVAAVILLVVSAALTVLHVPRLPETWVTHQPAWVQLVEVAILKDFLGYWNHRLFHHVPWLWRFHAVHHATEDVDWLAAAREHPLESVMSKVNTMVPLFLLGFSGSVLAPYVGFWAIYTLFLHANVPWSYGPFRWLLTSPAFHRWHHSSEDEAIDKNFSALLPFWDWLFGTAYFPKGKHSAHYGLAGGEKMPEGVKAQLAYGFQKRAPHTTEESHAARRAEGSLGILAPGGWASLNQNSTRKERKDLHDLPETDGCRCGRVGQARAGARRLQRTAGRRRGNHRRPTHPGCAAHDPVSPG